MSAKTNSFDSLPYIAPMLVAIQRWAAAEGQDVTDLGRIRPIHPIRDTHAGLPVPEKGDFACYGLIDGGWREFVIRGETVLFDRPAPHGSIN